MNQLLSAALPLATLAFVSSITPGPNNLMLMNSGARFGLLRTVPHLLGVSGGLAVLLLATYAGLGALLLQLPVLKAGLSLACALYLLWLAAKLMTAKTAATAATAVAVGPWSLGQAVMFQFLNPKCWGMALAGVALVASLPMAAPLQAALLVGVFSLLNLPCIALWALLGAKLARNLTGVRQFAFQLTMAALLLATAAGMVLPYVRGSM